MTCLKMIQLSTSEFKIDAPGDFFLNSNANCMVLMGNSCDVTVFELMYNFNAVVLMPYSNSQVSVSQNKPLCEIIKNVDFVKIYENATVRESQELALDVIYTADCAVEPIKARVVQADIVIKNNASICCVLTNYGYCEYFQKDISKEWKSLDTNLSNILFTEVFPPKVLPSSIKTLDAFKTFANMFLITCFAISQRWSNMIIYLGTAAGYIVALKYNETSCNFESYCNLKTSLNRISYIAVCNNLILASSIEGKILLVKINFDNSCLQELNYIWSITDYMSCRKAIFAFSESLGSYTLVFCKAAHVLAYRLDLEGATESNSTIYVSGIKITGIEQMGDTDFIITTITGAVKHIKISFPKKEELYCEELLINHDFDSSNYQILGVATSVSKNLWSFLLYRNKDYVHQSKYTNTTAFVNVCKLGTFNSFEKLNELNLKNMNTVRDLLIEVNLEIFNNMQTDKYMEYLKLENIKLPDEINDKFLQKMQLKILITRKLAEYQNVKYKKLKIQTEVDLEILEPTLHLLHVLRRLRYLKQLNLKDIKFSKFQELSICCMQMQFNHLLDDIAKIIHDEENSMRNVADKLVAFLNNEFEKYKFDVSTLHPPTEYCMMCNQAVTNFTKCEQNHDIKRCIISCTQLSLFETKYCPHCYAMARNDDAAKLQELYAADDNITCIYCKFLFQQDEFQFTFK